MIIQSRSMRGVDSIFCFVNVSPFLLTVAHRRYFKSNRDVSSIIAPLLALAAPNCQNICTNKGGGGGAAFLLGKHFSPFPLAMAQFPLEESFS